MPSRARSQLRSLLATARWPGDVDGAVLAIDEALTNADDHGGGVTSVDATVSGPTLILEVRDRGPGFDLGRSVGCPPNPLSEHGRGLWLIGEIADACDVHTTQGETCLRMRFGPERGFIPHA